MDPYQCLRPWIFRLRPEDAHDAALKLASLSPLLAGPWAHDPSPRLRVHVGQQQWRSPIGLAAGLDKNAAALAFFDRLGFGAMECGTLTPGPQAGNPKPRLHRYPEEASLRNSMGFPNEGMLAALPRLRARPSGFPLGCNIGKSKMASPEEALKEYATLYQSLAPHSDWIVINISSPNTPGLRDLQQAGWLRELFSELEPLRRQWGKEVYIKLSPDLEDQELDALVTLLGELGTSGIVATNTTHMPERGVGGISGRLLRAKAAHKRKIILRAALNLPVIGVGGFENFQDVREWWAAGGEALQIYTSFIYQGPGLLKNLEQAMLHFLQQHQLADVQTLFDLSWREREQILLAPHA